MINKLLVVPVQLDILRVEDELRVAGPLLEFTRLPWVKSPAHKDSPYLGETLATEAFEDRHQLQKGLHFHWSMPLALTRTSSIGLVYRQSFQSVFGKTTSAPGRLCGDEIWRKLAGAGWLEIIDERTGAALAQLPDEDKQAAWLQDNLPPGYAFAVRKLLNTPVFPPLPNRWILNRIAGDKVTSSRMIESDYLWPAGQDRLGDEPLSTRYTVYPQITDDPDEQPYRYLGRAVDYPGPGSAPDDSSYLDTPLTAVGYGETTFAAFYPICRSVFGHFDERLPAEPGEQVELIGLYANPEQDYFKLFVDAFRRRWQAEHETGAAESTHPQYRQQNYLYLDLLDAVQRYLRLTIPIEAPRDALEKILPDAGAGTDAPGNAWQYLVQRRWIDENSRLLPKAYGMKAIVGAPFQTRADEIRRALNEAIAAQMPERLVCYARVECPTRATPLPAVDRDRIRLALGNSPTEALSAVLADDISPTQKHIIEDQLEAIQFAAELQQTAVDTGAIFEALRHKKQFHPLPGGRHWVVRFRREESQKAGHVAEDEPVALPEALGNALNRLNQLEGEKDRNNAAIGSLRRQIYADWCWYLKVESTLKGTRPQFDEETGNPFGTRLGYDRDNRKRLPFGTRVRQFSEADEEPVSPASAADNPYVTGFISGFKTFISDQIDDQLAGLLDREAALDKEIAARFEIVGNALLDYQAQLQYLQESDIVDWANFAAATAGQSSALRVLGNLPPAGNRIDYLTAINRQLHDLDEVIPWPDKATPSDEYRTLAARVADKSDTTEAAMLLRTALLLRANRLALEAAFPGLIRHRAALELVPRDASRYWRPNDPVVYISGFEPSTRHQDARESLDTRLVRLDAPQPGPLPISDLAGTTLFADLRKGQTADVAADHWQPLFLSWDVAFSQAHQRQDETYGPDHLREHYSLGNVDFEPAHAAFSYETPVPFYGRSILTPGAGISLKQTLIGRLVPVIYRQFVDECVQSTDEKRPTIALFNEWMRRLDPDVENLPLDDPDLSDEQEIRQWLADELDLQNDTDGKLVQHLPAWLETDSRQPIIRQYLGEPGATHLSVSIDGFLSWAEARTHIKAGYAAGHMADLDEPLDIVLADRPEPRAAFVAHLTKQLGMSLSRYYDEMAIPADRQSGYLDDHYNELISWYQPQVEEALHLVVEIRAFQALLGIRGLAQSFSGFGDALIMRHQAFQLPVFNPFPYDGDHAFTDKVRAAVQTANTVAPGEHLPFSPWRAGKMALSELELLDNFGRYWPPDTLADLEAFHTHATETMPDVGEHAGREFAVPPRLAQGARLIFRWLAAAVEIEEINDRPLSNPICGWVVPNHLDDSLTIYAPGGEPLGFIDEGGRWRTFPGNSGPVLPADIANPHLAQMVQWLCAQGAGYLADFLDTLDIAHENMEPESYAQHEATALLMGHPLALVRADVGIQLHEPPAVDVSRPRVQADVQAYYRYKSGGQTPPGPPPARHSHNFEQVRIPLRLGEFHRLNDGLVGYWVEDESGKYAGDIFYAPQTTPTPGRSDRIMTRHRAGSEDREESDFLLYLSPDRAEPLKLSLLLDPRAPIHATSGVLPVEALYISSEQYAAALQRLQVAFLAAPLLAPEMGMEISLPTEPGYEWRWIETDGRNWSSISAEGILSKHQLREAFGPAADPLWGVLLQQGWLTALGDDTARMTPEDERAQADLPAPFTDAQEAVEVLFHRLRVRPFDPAAHFDGKHHLREGWLRLSPTER